MSVWHVWLWPRVAEGGRYGFGREVGEAKSAIQSTSLDIEGVTAHLHSKQVRRILQITVYIRLHSVALNHRIKHALKFLRLALRFAVISAWPAGLLRACGSGSSRCFAWNPCGADVIARLDPLYSTRLRSLKRALTPLLSTWTLNSRWIAHRCVSKCRVAIWDVQSCAKRIRHCKVYRRAEHNALANASMPTRFGGYSFCIVSLVCFCTSGCPPNSLPSRNQLISRHPHDTSRHCIRHLSHWWYMVIRGIRWSDTVIRYGDPMWVAVSYRVSLFRAPRALQSFSDRLKRYLFNRALPQLGKEFFDAMILRIPALSQVVHVLGRLPWAKAGKSCSLVAVLRIWDSDISISLEICLPAKRHDQNKLNK